MKKVGIISLGCAKNLVDSENILGLLVKNHYEITNNPAESDIIVINTCGFIEEAKKESIQTIFEYLQYQKPLVVTGCLVERYLNQLKKELPEVKLFIPIRDYYRFNELLDSIDNTNDISLGVSDEYRVVSTGDKSCYVKIGEGCSNYCTYCAIPLIRGPYVSRKLENIVSEVKTLVKKGYVDITLLEQDTSKYGSDFKDKNISIVTLLKELLKIDGLKFIRLLYLYPDEISDELIDLMLADNVIAPYFDIPIQHSETHILESMNRRGDKEYLKALFNKIKVKAPNAVIRTTLMVGFPGETEDDIDKLTKFVEEIKFDHIGVFTYSPEEGTKSYKFKDQIDEQTKLCRKDKVMKVAQRISYQRNKSRIGEEMLGLIVTEDDLYYSIRTYWNAPDDVDGKILVKKDSKHHIGDLIKINITEAFVYDLIGEII